MLSFLKALLGGKAVQTVSPQEAQALMGRGAVLLDVRGVSERQAQRIPGSQHLPLAEVRAQAERLPRDQIIVCQCASGKRSALAAAQLAAQGFEVRNLSGGIGAWQAAGLPTES